MNEVVKRALPLVGTLVIGIAIGNLSSDRMPWRRSSVPLSTEGSREAGPGLRSTSIPDTSALLAVEPVPTRPEKNLDTDHAVRDVLSISSRLKRQGALCDLILGLSPEELKSIIDSLDRLGKRDQEELLPMLLARWAEIDPAAAISFTMTSRSSAMARQKSAAMKLIFETWLASAPEAATAWVSSLPLGEESALARTSFTTVLAKSDPLAAFKLLSGGPWSDHNSRTYMELFRTWAERDPSAAATQVQQVSSLSERRMAIQGIVSAWGESNPASALAWAEQIPEAGVRSSALNTLYSVWAGTDPGGAAAHLLSMSPEKRTGITISSVVGGIALRDVQAAKSLAEQLPAGPLRDNACTLVVSHWAAVDPVAAAAYTEQLPLGSARDSAAKSLAKFWADHNPVDALTWAQRSLSGETLDSAVSEIGERWANIAPQAAADYFAKNASTSVVLSDVIGEWAGNDPHGAAMWAMRLPEGEARAESLSKVTELWSKEDVVGTAKWLEKLTAGKSRDHAVNTLVQNVAIADPEGAVSWAAVISDPGVRTNAVEVIFTNWKSRDADAARAWLAGTNLLSPQTKAQWLQQR